MSYTTLTLSTTTVGNAVAKGRLLLNILHRELFFVEPESNETTKDRSKSLGPLRRTSLGRPASEWNRLYERYYEFAESLDIEILKMSPQEAYASPNHEWGMAPFHYVDGAYKNLSDQLEARLSDTES